MLRSLICFLTLYNTICYLSHAFSEINADDKVMEKLLVCLLAFIVAGNLTKEVLCQCEWKGFGGCECNILGACGMHVKPTDPFPIKTLQQYAPVGLEIFSAGDGLKQNLAYLCEGDTVAIMYDCNKRIPLYAGTMMEGWQLNAAYDRPDITFKPSNDQSLNQQLYQQSQQDYAGSASIEICYDTISTGRKIDYGWYVLLNPGKPWPSNCDQITGNKVVAIHKGHLIAARYGRGDPDRATATFTFTNIVPQFGKFNSGKWNSNEGGLLTWGRDYCAKYNGKATKNVKMFIVVGAIPSTFPIPSAQPRYFGKSGFSDFSCGNYRVNVPSKMWTAACCIFQFQDSGGSWKDGTRHTAFWRDNNPGKEQCDKAADINQLFDQFQSLINLFPAHPGCAHKTNYVSI